MIARANAPTQVQLDLGGSPGWLVIHHPDRSVSCVASTLTETWARGEHTVFVGRTASDTAGTPFTLSLRTTPSPVVPYTP